MPLHASRIKGLFLISFLLGSASSWASDLQCGSTQQPAQRVICDHAILNNEYDDIYAQQQTLLQEGKLTAKDLVAWQQRRDACNDVQCIDGVFAAWGAVDKSLENNAVVPDMAASSVMTASDALGPASGALPAASAVASATAAADAGQQASGVPVSRQGSAYGVALPQSVPSVASAPAPVSAASGSAAADSISSSPLLPVLAVLLVIALLSVGAMMIYQRRRGR